MKAVFIPFNQAYQERLIDILTRMNIRGFTLWEEVKGRGTNYGEPHYGDHAWPILNSSILTMVRDEQVKPLLKRIHELDMETEQQGIRAFVWNVEDSV